METCSAICFRINCEHPFISAKAELECTRNMRELHGDNQYGPKGGIQYRVIANGVGDKLSEGFRNFADL